MNPSVQYFNKPMMYGSPFSVEQNMVGPTPVNAFNEPMGYNTPGNMISMEFIPSPIGFNNGRYGAIVTANNGLLYMFASNGSGTVQILKIDPFTNIITTVFSSPAFSIPGGFSGRKWMVSPAGTIISIMGFQTVVGEFDPVTETYSSFGSGPAGGSKSWGGVIAPNGKIYCAPYLGTSIQVIDAINRTTYTFGSFGGGLKWGAPILAPNGKIYCPPYADNRVLVIDPKDDTFYFLKDDILSLSRLKPGGNSTSKYWNGTLAYDGKIYCTGYGALNTLVIDPETDTCSSFNPINGNLLGTVVGPPFSGAYPSTGILGTNGKIYGSYYFANDLKRDNARIREFDPYTRTYSSIGIPESLNEIVLNTSAGGPSAYGGGCLAPNGKIYFSPTGCNFIAVVSGLPPATPEMWQVPKDVSKIATSLFNYHTNGNANGI
jgi:streptogramin lyase